MISEWGRWLFGPTNLDQLYHLLWAAASVLLAAAVVFLLVTVRLRVLNIRKEARWSGLERKWEPAILRVLGNSSPQGHLHSLVETDDALYFLAFLLRYSRRLTGQEREVVHELAQPYLPDLVRLVSQGTPEGRARAVRSLAELGGTAYASAIAPALDDPSPLVAMVAARSLFVEELPEYFEPVLARIERFELWSPGYLAGMLAAGGEAAVPLLRKALARRDGEPAFRAVAAEALTRLNDIEAAAVASSVIAHDYHPDLITACIKLLGRLGNAEHVEAVRPWISTSGDVIRAAAIRAIGALGGKDEVPTLVEHLEDRSTWVALQAARGLLDVGARDMLERCVLGEGRGRTVALQVLAE